VSHPRYQEKPLSDLILFLNLGESITMQDYLGKTQVQIRLAIIINPRLVPTAHKAMPSKKLMTYVRFLG
jgi:hypothetical protein